MSDLIRCHIKGSGRPLLLIHGWAMHAGVWQGFVDQLAGHCQTIALDLRGHGESRRMEGPYSFEQHARDVISVIDHLRLRDAVLLGWSMGVSIILKMAAMGFDRARALVLVSGNPSLVQRPDYECALAPVVVKRLLRQVQRDYAQALSIFQNLMCTAEEHARCSCDPAYLAAMDSARCPPQQVAADTLACLLSEDLRPHVPRIQVPALIVHGERDEICLCSGGRSLAEHSAAAHLHLLPDTGHMPFVTRRDSVVKSILNFLSNVMDS